MIMRISRLGAKFCVLSLLGGAVFLSSSNLSAQQSSSQIQALEPREAIGSILISGLVGGILGLSTLSFYTRPQDNIRNISIGAGIGMIAAAIYMTYSVTESAASAQGRTMNSTQEAQWSVMPDYDAQSGVTGARYVLNF
jgi:hypothetical protein